MAIRVGSLVSDAVVDYWVRGAHGPKKMSLQDYRGKWVVLFFYPRDFTFICPTEIAAFGTLQSAFEQEDAVVIGASTDSFFSHKAWFEQDERLKEVNFPVMADTAHSLAREFDVLLDDGATLRGTYIIDPDGVIQHMSVNSLDVGRSIEETLRVLQGLKCGELCPVGWQPGADTMTTYNEWLGQVFPHLMKNALADASGQLQTITYSAGDVIVRQDDSSDQFFIVIEGEVSVVHHTASGEQINLANLGTGEVFGEMGILLNECRSADVRAQSDVTLLALDWANFKALLDSSDRTAQDFMRMVEQRRAALPA